MGTASVRQRGRVVIPAEIRSKYGLSAVTQAEFVDDGGTIRSVVRRRVAPSDPQAEFGMIKVKSAGRVRRLSDFGAASVVGKSRR